MIVIGEKINGSIPSVAEAIAKRDAEVIKQRAIAQTEAGATFIDCCASVSESEEVETLHWMIDCIQEVTDLPIAVDSPSASVIAQAYKFCNKPGLFNSVSGEGDKMDILFPVMAEAGNEAWQVVALLSDDTGIPKCAADRLKVFDKIMAKAEEYGIAPDRIHIDPLVEMLCTSEDGIAMVEEVMDTIRSKYPTIHITGAVSNISFNLPYRKIVNMGFTVLSIKDGLDSSIFDPLNKGLMGLIAATEAIEAKGGVTADFDFAAVEAELPEAQKCFVYPAYVSLAMKAGVLMPEYDEEYDEYDVESFVAETKGNLKPGFSVEDYTGLVFATNALLGNDDMCMAYIGGYRDELFGQKK